MKRYLVTYYEIGPIHEIPISAKDHADARRIAIALAPFVYEYFEIEEIKDMKLYEVEVTADCVASITKSYAVEANNPYEARLKAKEEMKADIERRNDVTEILNIEFGYTGVLKQ